MFLFLNKWAWPARACKTFFIKKSKEFYFNLKLRKEYLTYERDFTKIVQGTRAVPT
jgi:hypothetical protein